MPGTAMATEKRHHRCSEDGIDEPLNSTSQELRGLWTSYIGHRNPSDQVKVLCSWQQTLLTGSLASWPQAHSLSSLVLLGHSVDTPIRLTINGKGPKGNKSLSSRISQRHDASVLYLMAWDWNQTLSRMSCFLQVWISFFLRSLKPSLIFPASSTLHSFICAVVCWSWLLTCSWESIVHISTPLWVQWYHVGSLKSAKVFVVFLINLNFGSSFMRSF